MSDNVLSYGWMAPLVKPIKSDEDDWEEISEGLYNINLHISYDGTIIFSDNRTDEPYGLFFAELTGKQEFIDLCNTYDFSINKDQARSYVCAWYNGTDSNMSLMTLEKFQQQSR